MENAYIPQLSIQPTFGTSPQDDSPDISLLQISRYLSDSLALYAQKEHWIPLSRTHRSKPPLHPLPDVPEISPTAFQNGLASPHHPYPCEPRYHTSNVSNPRSKLSPNPDFPPKESPLIQDTDP